MKRVANITISSFIAAAILTCSHSSNSTSAIAQTSEYRFPPNTPVTCSQPERKKIYSDSRTFYGLDSNITASNRNIYFANVERMNAAWGSWYQGCERLCKRMPPIKPTGYGWQYSGQYGSTTGQRGCKDEWIKLVRKDGDRVTFEPNSTNRQEEAIQAPSKYNPSLIVKCNTRELWDDKLGWAPIKPYTIVDDAVDKFC